MSISHLTDYQIQSYADDDPKLDTREMARHLDLCRQCQKQLKAYLFVRKGMTQEVQSDFFSKNFEDDLMTRILKSEARGYQLRDRLIFAFAVGIIISLLGLPLLYEQVRLSIIDSYVESWVLLKDTATGLFCRGETVGSCFIIPAIALLMFLAFLVLDETYIKSRLKIIYGNGQVSGFRSDDI